jgi:aspartyl/asparaginyl beta-hydroxylase (cupin superfamily)
MVSGSAYFSVLSPGARLRAHCGPTNIRLRVHIGLSVSPGASIRVGNETRSWANDEALIFDDSFEHAVWNDSPDPRLVFIFDVWHPMLRTDDERLGALDPVGRERYRRAAASLRAGVGLPEEVDLVAERRQRTIY